MAVADQPTGGLAASPARAPSAPRRGTAAALRLSYVKTIVPAAVVGVLAIALAHHVAVTHATLVRLVVEGIGWTLGLGLECAAAGGLLVMIRESGDATGKADLFLRANHARSERSLLAGGRDSELRWAQAARRALGQGWPVVGDEVRIRPRDEIERTLDADGRLDGLPFMAEMAQFCGRQARVFRCVDKIYDYGGAKTLRRIEDVVLLAGLRCDGSAHGGCQASCYLLWKKAWLGPVAGPARALSSPSDQSLARRPESVPFVSRYKCQFTELVAASRAMASWDIRQDLRPLLTGNVSLGAFGVAVLTRIFNAVQRARGGAGYPAAGHATPNRTTVEAHRLAPGDLVRVRAREEISATLDERGRNRGLWFDRDMVKHCGRCYSVLKRVDRIIDDATGRMLTMKNPCLVLDGVDSSGEFLRFCPQHEYPFWREEWLSPEPGAGSS